MYLKTKSGRKVYLNSEQEEAELNAQIAADPEDEELGEDFFKNARPVAESDPAFLAAWQKAKREGTLEIRPIGRPKLSNPKKQVTLRLDDEVLTYFRAGGKGWQTRLNAALQEYIQSL
jgi:uncharacterized protein (DUF4415 family)